MLTSNIHTVFLAQALVILCAEPKVSSIYYEIIIVLILENDYLKRTREMNVLSEKEQR